jgi:hypothetical protein
VSVWWSGFLNLREKNEMGSCQVSIF